MQFHSHCLKGVRIYLYNIGKKLFKTSTQDRKLFVGRGLPNGRRLKKKARKKTKKTTTNAPTTSCVLDLKQNTTDYSSEELTWIQSNAVLLDENSTVFYAIKKKCKILKLLWYIFWFFKIIMVIM